MYYGKVVNIPCKAAELFREAKRSFFQRQSMFSENWLCCMCPGVLDYYEHLLVPELFQWSPAPRAEPRVHQEQRCCVWNNENKAERSCASCNVMVAKPGINLDLLAPYLMISPLDVFLFSFENVDSLLERKIYKHYTFHCQKRGFVIWYRNSFNYWGNFTAWGHKGQIC